MDRNITAGLKKKIKRPDIEICVSEVEECRGEYRFRNEFKIELKSTAIVKYGTAGFHSYNLPRDITRVCSQSSADKIHTVHPVHFYADTFSEVYRETFITLFEHRPLSPGQH